MADKNQVPNKIPDDQLEESLRSGAIDLSPNQQVSVISPDGTPGFLPGNEVKDALDAGFQIETARKKAVRSYVDEKKKNPLTGLGVFGAQAADELFLGIPETVFDKTANPFEVEKKEALKKEYEAWNNAGGIAGFGASFIAPGASLVFKGATKAGVMAEKAVASRLAAKGIEKGSGSIAKELVARVGEATARGVTEGLVMTAPRAITEASLGDPKAAAEALMMGGGLGAAFGTAFGTTGTLFNKLKSFNRKRIKIDPTKEVDNAFVNEAGERTTPDPLNPGDNTLVGKLKADGVADDLLKEVSDLTTREVKKNSKEIIEAASELQLPVLEEQLTSNKFVQDMADTLSKRPTLSGRAKAQEYAQRFDLYDDVIKASVGPVDNLSVFESGSRIKDQILGQAKTAIDKEAKVFQAIEQEYAAVPLSQRGLNQIAKNIEDLQVARIDSKVKGIAKDIAGALKGGRVRNLSDVKQLRSTLWGMSALSPNEKRIISEISEKLNLLEDSTIDRAVKQIIDAPAVPGSATLEKATQLRGLYEDMQQAKKNWRSLAEQFEEAGDSLSLGNIRNPRDFVERLQNTTAEDLVKKLLPKNDVASLQVLKKQFPEQFQVVAQMEKAKLLEGIVEDGMVRVRPFITKYRKLTKEVKDVLFSPDQQKKLAAVATDLESLPKNANPSGTAKVLDIITNFSNPMTALLDNVFDYGRGQAIRKSVSIEGILGTEKEIIRIRSRIDSIPKTIEKAFDKTAPVRKSIDSKKTIDAIQRILNDPSSSKQDSIRKIQEKISNDASDNSALFNRIGEDMEAMASSGAPQIANAYGSQLMKTTNYLYSVMPKNPNVKNPLLQEDDWKPSDTELAKFERKLSVAIDPFTAIDALEEGSLTKDHVESLAQVYPLFYQAMKSKIVTAMIEKPMKIPYQNRLKLSLLLGLDVERSISPQSIVIYQNAFLNPEAQKEDSGLNEKGLMKLGRNITETTATVSKATRPNLKIHKLRQRHFTHLRA